jgi:hypothetical protein
VPNNSCANENVCSHVSQQDAKTHQCNLISDPIVLVRLLTQRLGDNPPPVPHQSNRSTLANAQRSSNESRWSASLVAFKKATATYPGKKSASKPIAA